MVLSIVLHKFFIKKKEKFATVFSGYVLLVIITRHTLFHLQEKCVTKLGIPVHNTSFVTSNDLPE